MKRIVVYIRDLQSMDWSITYQFIEGCLGFRQLDSYVLDKMNELAYLAVDSSSFSCDVILSDSLESFSPNQITDNDELSFVFITKPINESVQPLDYVPLFILQRNYCGLISIGIDLINIPERKQGDFTFRFSTFYLFVKDMKPVGGIRSLYFINEINDKAPIDSPDRYYENRISSFKYKSRRYSKSPLDKVVKKQSSTKFYPLLHIDENLFLCMFQNKEDYVDFPEEVKYLMTSSEKIINQLKHVSKLSTKKFSSLFEKWFVCAYFNSLSTIVDNKTFEVLYPILHSYYIGIYELVQNIIFHTREREGWIYVYFCKQDNLSSEIISKLSKYDVDFSPMYLRFGIYDFSHFGILDTYNTKQSYELDDLAYIVDPFIIVPGNDQENEYLCLTYAAHLGIKTLVSSVLSHHGLFRIETNHVGRKVYIENEGNTLCQQRITENVEGTHYDIVLPINAQENNTQPYQVKSQNAAFSHMLKNRKKIQSIRMNEIVNRSYHGYIIDNEHQDQVLNKIKDLVSKLFARNSGQKYLSNYCALDMSGVELLTANMIFKILAAMQIGDSRVKVVVLYNLSDDTIDDVCNIVKSIGNRKNKSNQPIWSRDHAVVLMNESFRIQILSGETKREISSLNAWFEGRYNGFTNVFSEWNYKENDISPEVDNKFLLPYECMIYDNNNKPLFFNRVSAYLDKTVNTNNDYGFLADGIFTKIGSKIYVEKFYDAHTLFLNSFFVDRLAFFFANDIIRRIGRKLSQKNIVLIGYRLFSDLTIRKIQSYINSYAESDVVQDIIIADDGAKTEESILSFRPVIDIDNNQQRRRFHNSVFVLIVPVASTLSTHDKIVTYFKKEARLEKEPLFFNYCAILVRDGKHLSSISAFERDWQWNSLSNDSIETGLPGAGRVTYLVSKTSRWHYLIDDKTFPPSYADEIYLNRTGDPSLNLWDMFGYPTVSLPSMDLIKDEVLHFSKETDSDNSKILETYFKIIQNRIKELSQYIYVGHMSFGHNHHRYFFDTENYLRHGYYKELTEWMRYIKEKHRLWRDHSKVPVIIVPEYNKESTFTHLVNEELFDENALIICIDVSDSIDKVRSNYSFLSQNSELFSFYFIDHAILTSETYEKTRICLSAIMNKPDFRFNGIMVIVNRLSEMKYINISENLDGGIINSFVHFFIPPSKNMGEDCTLCGLKKHYGGLLSLSVVEACRRAIKSNMVKFNLEKDLIKGHNIGNNDRKYKRMELRNNLFLMIACIQKDYPIDFIINYRKRAATNEMTNEESLVNRLEDALSRYYQNLSNDIDSKISFLKAITFPPLSQYVYIRRFAHGLTIKELKRILSNPHPKYEDFCMLKTLLKHLSWLSSNAIIRKEVIISSWRLCFKVANDILNEIHESDEKENNSDPNNLTINWIEVLRKQLLEIEEFGTYYQFCIKNATYIDKAKSFYLGELLRTGNEIDVRLPLKASETTLYNPLFAEIKVDEIPKFSLIHKEYVVHNPFNIFLSNVYYDNTTIFRKTLDNFSNEIKKDKELSLLFYVDLNDYKPYDFELFNNKVNRICEKMLDIVNTQYYYSWFRCLLTKDFFNPSRCLDATRDGVPLIRKLIYVLYAKMTINHILKKERLNIEEDANKLLRIFSAIMDSNHSFISISFNKKLYTLASNNANVKFATLKKNLFCGRYLAMAEGRVMYPFIIKESSISTDEKRLDEIRPNRLCCQLLSKDRINRKNNHLYFGAVTYLYDGNEMNFQIQKLESSRILLLLKPEIDKYVKECNKDKLFELWLKNMNTNNRFKRINLSSNHSLSLDGWDFEKLDIKNYKKMDNGFYMLSNLVISHLFSILTVEHNIRIKSATKNIDEIFSDKFLSLLDELSINRWGNKLKIIKTKGDDERPFTENALIIQSFVIQCINNAYEKLTKKNGNKHFVIKLIIGSSFIEIWNNFPGIEMTKILREKKKFDKLYSLNTIKRNLTLDRMSDYGMTLSSLLIYGNSDNMKCECGFDLSDSPSFRVKLSSTINSTSN